MSSLSRSSDPALYDPLTKPLLSDEQVIRLTFYFAVIDGVASDAARRMTDGHASQTESKYL